MDKFKTLFCEKCDNITSHRFEKRPHPRADRYKCRDCEKQRRKPITEDQLQRKRKKALEYKKPEGRQKESSAKYAASKKGILKILELKRAYRDRLISESVGKTCPIVIVKCRECGVCETKKGRMAKPGKSVSVYCSAHANKHKHSKEFVQIRKVEKICVDCGCITLGNAARKRCDPCARRLNRVRHRSDPKAIQAKKDSGHSLRQRARRVGAYMDTVSKRVVFERDNYKCVECGVKVVRSIKWQPNQATIDHRVPLSLGGAHTYENCQTMCMMCNSKKCNTMPNDVQLTIFDRV